MAPPNLTDGMDPDGLLGNETLQYHPGKTELYVVIGYLSVLSAMGTAGNALVLYVFSQKKDKLVSTLFIIVLALVDFTTCLVVIPYTMYMEYVDFHIKYDVLCKSYQFLITSNIPFSALIMVAIAIDRYFCICHPFLHAINLQRAKIMIGALAMIAAGFGVIVALMFGVYHQAAVPTGYTGNFSTIGAGAVNGTGFDVVEADDSREMINAGYSSINAAGNGSGAPPGEQLMEHVVVYSGQCGPNYMLISETFQFYYQKVYTAMYLVCLIIVIVLYVLIYKSVLARRTKRAKQKSKSLPLVTSLSTAQPDSNTEETLLTTVNGTNGEAKDGVKNGSTKSAKSKDKDKDKSQKRKSTKRDKNRMANLKTAAMLFVVTVVFIVTFAPAFLMVLQLITYQMWVFYLYFANNVANPIIYSFMNKNFRDDLKRLFCSGR